jgi:hypothetical protein
VSIYKIEEICFLAAYKGGEGKVKRESAEAAYRPDSFERILKLASYRLRRKRVRNEPTRRAGRKRKWIATTARAEKIKELGIPPFADLRNVADRKRPVLFRSVDVAPDPSVIGHKGAGVLFLSQPDRVDSCRHGCVMHEQQYDVFRAQEAVVEDHHPVETALRLGNGRAQRVWRLRNGFVRMF